MGWSAGTEILESIIRESDDRLIVSDYEVLFNALRDQDWDNVDEVIGLSKKLDEAIRILEPYWFEEEE